MMEAITSLSLLPGFGFHPTDVELIDYFLKRKILSFEEEFEIIPELDIYKHEPWDLPGKSPITSRKCQWHFFTPHDRKYPNGARRNRSTEAGYWKATGKDRHIRHQRRIIGTKKSLVFHRGRAPKGERTDWIMHEYHINENECKAAPGMHDAFVLCLVFKKNGMASQDEGVIGAPSANSDCSLTDQACLASTSINCQNHAVESTSEIRDEGLQKMPTSPSMISNGLTSDGLQLNPVPCINSDIISSVNELQIESLTGHPGSLSLEPNLKDPYPSLNLQDFPDLDSLQLPFWLSESSDVNNQKTATLLEEQKVLEEIYFQATEASNGRSKVDALSPLPDFTVQGNMVQNARAWDSTGFEVGENNGGNTRIPESTDSGSLFDSNETGIRRRTRPEKSQEGKCFQYRIRLQVYNMQSRVHRPVETCTFDQNVQIVEKTDSDLGSETVCGPDQMGTETRVKLKSGKSSAASDSHLYTSQPEISGPSGSLPENGEYSNQNEQVHGFFRRIFMFFQQFSYSGSSFVFSAGCILGSASLIYFPLRTAWRSLNFFSWMSS